MRRMKMIIKVLGPGCKNCVSLKENTEKAMKEMGIEAEIIKVEDMKDIASYGVMRTPALVIDEKVVSYGKVLKPNDIIKLLEKNK
jgi:small redox-active disulfide protein 2